MNPKKFTFTRRYQVPLEELFVMAERALGLNIPRPPGIDFSGAKPLSDWIVPNRNGLVLGLLALYPHGNPSRKAIKEFLESEEAFAPDLFDSLAFLIDNAHALTGTTVFPSGQPVRYQDRAHLYLVIHREPGQYHWASFQTLEESFLAGEPSWFFGLSKDQEGCPIPWCEELFRKFS